MSKERLYLFDTTLRARSRAGAGAPSTNKTEGCRRAGGSTAHE
jgi:hypothetical protein